MSQIYTRHDQYDKEHCWQYDIRLNNLDKDIESTPLSKKQIESLTADDFYFDYVPKENKPGCTEIRQFIERHEWLGTLPNRPTHRFVARTKEHDLLAGVIIMAVPNTFSGLLGKDRVDWDKVQMMPCDLEKLVSRGACISWSPKNLASWLIMRSIHWMVKNTSFRLFTAYSDPEAKELGTVYQACNWMYLGCGSGTIERYFDPENPDYGWFSDRNFRHKSKYFRYFREAREQGIIKEDWNPVWMGKYTPKWTEMPEHVVHILKQGAKDYQERCVCREVPAKHKYAYILGADKRETRLLQREFARLNPDKVGLDYPKERGK